MRAYAAIFNEFRAEHPEYVHEARVIFSRAHRSSAFRSEEDKIIRAHHSAEWRQFLKDKRDEDLRDAEDELAAALRSITKGTIDIGTNDRFERSEIGQAVDEIFLLRGVLAQQIALLETLMNYASFPAGQRQAAEQQIIAMRLAASKGTFSISYGVAKRALQAAGLPQVLTNETWKSQAKKRLQSINRKTAG